MKELIKWIKNTIEEMEEYAHTEYHQGYIDACNDILKQIKKELKNENTKKV